MNNLTSNQLDEVCGGSISFIPKSGGVFSVSVNDPYDSLEFLGFEFSLRGCYFNGQLVKNSDTYINYHVFTHFPLPDNEYNVQFFTITPLGQS